MKPESAGTLLPAAALPASTEAVTCEPSDAPTERTTALKPVASPVRSSGTAATIRLGMAAKARPMPTDRIVL